MASYRVIMTELISEIQGESMLDIAIETCGDYTILLFNNYTQKRVSTTSKLNKIPQRDQFKDS